MLSSVMTYGISSRDYISRAKRCLASNSIESLFYAAFELRCGVEARMQQYLEVQSHISRKKRQGWQVAKLGKNIEDVFKIGEKEAVLKVIAKDTGEIMFEARYTPVKKSLRKKTEKFGNVLHAAKAYHAEDSPYWKELRAELDAAVIELEHANSGRLLGPLLLHPNRKSVDMKLEILTHEEQENVKPMAIGVETILEITYE